MNQEKREMQVSPKVKDIVSKICDGHSLTRDEIVHLLSINHKSLDAGFIMTAANVISRMVSNGQAEVHAQIGLNLSPCPNDCSFCAFAAKNGVFNESK
jgi:biotin synthase